MITPLRDCFRGDGGRRRSGSKKSVRFRKCAGVLYVARRNGRDTVTGNGTSGGDPPCVLDRTNRKKGLGANEHDLQREEGRTVVEEVARFIRVGKQWKRKPEVRMVEDNDQGR